MAKQRTIEQSALDTIKTMPFKDYPQDAKSVTVQTLHNDLKMDVAKIARTLGMGKTTAFRYLGRDIKEGSEWNAFRMVVKRMFEHKRSNLYARVLSQLENQLPQAKFYEAVGLAKILQDADREDNKVSIKSDNTMVFQVVKDSK